MCDAKVVLKDWNHNTFGNINTQIRKIVCQIQDLESRNSVHDRNIIIELKHSLEHWYNVEHAFWVQRGKEDALKYDDRNTAYFHNKENFRKKRTQIDDIKMT